MEENIKKIESVFRDSFSSEELFDAFAEAMKLRVNDVELFKILLANPSLSIDEVKMFAEKIIREMPKSLYQISMWCAKVFENYAERYEYLDSSINYYLKAINALPTNFEPLVSLLNLYNMEIETPVNKRILEIVNGSIPPVNFKSKVYYALADLYKHLGDLDTASRNLALAAKAAEREGQ